MNKSQEMMVFQGRPPTDTSHQLKEGKGSAKKYPRFLHDPRAKMLTKFISIGGYLPEVRAFVTLIKSTKVIRLIICKTL